MVLQSLKALKTIIEILNPFWYEVLSLKNESKGLSEGNLSTCFKIPTLAPCDPLSPASKIAISFLFKSDHFALMLVRYVKESNNLSLGDKKNTWA